MQDTQPFLTRLLTALLFFFIAYYFLFIDLLGDPSIFKRWGDFADEGYWLNGAKNFLYSGHISNGIDELNQAEIGAPLYTLVLYLSFLLFDDSVLTARSVSVFFSSLVVFTLCLTNLISLKNKFIFTGLFITSSTVISYAQWGTPQAMQSFFEFLAILLLCISSKSYKNCLYFSSGAAAACVISTKLSGYIFLGCYFAVLLLLFLIVRNFKSIAFALAGLLIFIAPLALYLLVHYSELQIFLEGLGSHGALLNNSFPFIEFRPLFFLVYSYDQALKLILFLGILSGVFLLIPYINKLKLTSLSPENHIYIIFPAIMILLYCFLTITADIADRRVYSFIIPAIMCLILFIESMEQWSRPARPGRVFLCNFSIIFLILLNCYQFSIIKSDRTFSHYELSVDLNKILEKHDCVTGISAHWLIADTRATPIWYRKDDGLRAFNPQTPFTASKECQRSFLISGLFEGRVIHEELSNADLVNKAFTLQPIKNIVIPSSGRLKAPRFDGQIFEIHALDL